MVTSLMTVSNASNVRDVFKDTISSLTRHFYYALQDTYLDSLPPVPLGKKQPHYFEPSYA